MRAYNLFRHRDKQNLVCAVPEDRAVPSFITAPAWDFDRKFTGPAVAPIGFDASAASNDVQLNGFYLFQSFSK